VGRGNKAGMEDEKMRFISENLMWTGHLRNPHVDERVILK
jgi:hypothetical protein